MINSRTVKRRGGRRESRYRYFPVGKKKGTESPEKIAEAKKVMCGDPLSKGGKQCSGEGRKHTQNSRRPMLIVEKKIGPSPGKMGETYKVKKRKVNIEKREVKSLQLMLKKKPQRTHKKDRKYIQPKYRGKRQAQGTRDCDKGALTENRKLKKRQRES